MITREPVPEDDDEDGSNGPYCGTTSRFGGAAR
ncbi:hypothetical protein GA0115242_1048121 [Streptomyces sp. SolWspMP-5a-2]|nr:hypothetical protein GA0115242_1048121 [Streptomyces sp. SolWspMP-5a-2]